MAIKQVKTDEVKFTKKQLLESKKYRFKRDVLSVVLKDDVLYAFESVDQLINNFMEQEAK